MNRGLLFITFVSTAAILTTQACSSEESTSTMPPDASASSSSGSTSGATASSSGDNSSGGEEEDTCVTGGGACVCGGLTTPCPTGGTREPSLKCKQGPQGSGQCMRTCCKGGDSGPPPDPDAAIIVEAGPEDAGSDVDAQ